MKIFISHFSFVLFFFFISGFQCHGKIFPCPGMKAPDFSITSSENKTIKLSDYRGKIVILNFWAFWCDTWQYEADGFYSLKKDFPNISFNILSVSIDGQLDILSKKKKELIYYPILLDRKEEISTLYGIDNVPTVFLIDRDGIVRYKFRGYPGTVELYNSIKKLTEEKIKNSLCKKIHLTFDDFPQGKESLKLLDILKEKNIKATFFVIGEKGKEYPQIIKRASLEGHKIEVHCYKHTTFSSLKEDEIKKELYDTSNLIYTITGTAPSLFRPPGGKTSPLIENTAMSLGLKTVMWTINPYDYQRPGKQLLAERILGELKEEEEIILLHDGVSETKEILSELIDICKDRGYEFINW